MTQIKKFNQVSPMTYLVVKVKDQDLFFNADEAIVSVTAAIKNKNANTLLVNKLIGQIVS